MVLQFSVAACGQQQYEKAGSQRHADTDGCRQAQRPQHVNGQARTCNTALVDRHGIRLRGIELDD